MGGVPSSRRAVVQAPKGALTCFVVASLLGAAAAEGAGVAGRVLRNQEPVANAAVYAYQVVERTYRAVSTDRAGEFLFEELPAGLYKIVAHKSGVPPAVLVLARKAADESQYVQVELPESAADGASDFWALRGEVPSDVLRDLDPTSIALTSFQTDAPMPAAFLGGVEASASMRELGSGHFAEMTGAEVGLHGELGSFKLQLDGEFQNIAGTRVGASTRFADDALAGSVASFRVGLENPAAGQLGITGRSHELLAKHGRNFDTFSFDQYEVSYVRDFGDDRSTDLMAQYLETAAPSEGRVLPRNIPTASRLLAVQGSYLQLLGDSSRLRAGMRYRESYRVGPWIPGELGAARFLDLWSRGETELDSAMVVQYGLFTTTHDGAVSLSPKGGLVVRLNPHWQASVAATHRFVSGAEDPLRGDSTPQFLADTLGCENVDTSCYETEVLRGEGEDSTLRLKGSFREFDRTVRLFVRDDFLASGEGIFFVPGDRLPELEATLSQRLGSSVVASWSTRYAAGGGGEFRATNRNRYQNNVEIFSTAIETRIEPTATGIYLAFQRVDQNLEPVRRPGRRAHAPSTTQFQRLEVAVSQDVSQLFDLASSWAVRLGMELARGTTLLAPAESGKELRRRLTTSVAVRF